MARSLFFGLVVVLSVVFVFVPPALAKDGVIARHASAAGKFYVSNPDALRGQVTSFLKDRPDVKLEARPIALIAPHAGYIYSGLVAGKGYSLLENYDYNRVIILAPSHYGTRFRGVSVVRFTHYKTPLGLVEVDRKICDKILNSSHIKAESGDPLFGTVPNAHIMEHSIETQLPFLQVALGDFKIVPLLVGGLKEGDYKQIAKVLKPYIDKNTLIVTSTDFLHYGERFSYRPFSKDVEKNINKYDQAAFNVITAVDLDALYYYKRQTDANICGFRPIILLLHMLPRTAVGQLVDYDTSGRQTGDFTYSVSYASIVFTKQMGER